MMWIYVDLAEGVIGPLFSYYIAEQFARLREGDYYYYENDPYYTDDERESLGSTTIADIILRNTESTFTGEPSEGRRETNLGL